MASSQPQVKPRYPPPSLFLGPPSRNNSELSIPALPTNPSRPGLLRPRSSLNPLPTTTTTQPDTGPSPLSRITTNTDVAASKIPAANATATTASSSGLPVRAPATGTARNSAVTSGQQQQKTQTQTQDRAEALWASMQRTLEEVELDTGASASKQRHVFGASHVEALEALREAQARLAEAWGRGEGEGEEGLVTTEGEDADYGEADGERLEEETEGDIRLARKRREANDRYFRRVDGGVKEVVERLRGVAGAMTRIERESRDVWSEGSGSATAEESSM